MTRRSGSLLACVFGTVVAMPAHALLITSERAVSLAQDNTQFVNVRQDTADTAAGRDLAAVSLGNGTNAFGQPTAAGAFGAFPTQQGVYWVSLNADNTRNLGDDGLGFARVQLTYKAIKQFGDTAFVLNIVPGLLEIDDPGAGSTPLSASVTLDAGVFGPTGDRLTGASAHADLTGNGGTFQTETFDLDSSGLGATLTKLDDGGNNVVGATAVWGARQLPLDLSHIVDGTQIEIDVDLTGNVFAPGGETIASAFFRDPAHANDPDPLAGASTVTFETAAAGPGTAVPEPSGLAVIGPGLVGIWVWRRQRPIRQASLALSARG